MHEERMKSQKALCQVVDGIEQQKLNRERNLQRFKDDLKTK